VPKVIKSIKVEISAGYNFVGLDTENINYNFVGIYQKELRKCIETIQVIRFTVSRFRFASDGIYASLRQSRLKAMKKGLYSLHKYPVHPVF